MPSYIHSLFVHNTKNTRVKLFRYYFVALAAFAVDFGGLIALHQLLDMHYLLAETISFCGGVVVNYYLSTKWIFLNPRVNNKKKEFLGTLLIACIGLGINNLILWTLTSIVGIYYIVSKLIATGIVFFWNFFARKKALYYD